MGGTLAEKILAAHAGRDQVRPDEIVQVRADVVMANDITAGLAIDAFERLGAGRVFDPERVCFVPSHQVPNVDLASASLNKRMREFARQHGCVFFEQGQGGIEHILIPEQGYVGPGEVYLGADSHTCTVGAVGAFATGMGSTDIGVAMATGTTWMKVPRTIRVHCTGHLADWVTTKDLILEVIGRLGTDGATYRALEFDGPAIAAMSMDARFTLANMVIEAGAKAGIVTVDGVTLEYTQPRARRDMTPVYADTDAAYERTLHIDCSALETTVALPFSPGNRARLDEVVEGEPIDIDQVFIGSCTNGKLEDLRLAASVLRGQRVASGVRCIVIPATQEIYRQALAEGLIGVFADAGCAVSSGTCGPCGGGHFGILAEGERCVSTSNRNFPGRMGHRAAEVYLANPAVAAASAVAGLLAHPGRLPLALGQEA